MIDLEREIGRAVETGNVVMGFRRTVKELKKGKVRLVIMASNSPEELKNRMRQITEYVEFPGSNKDLGIVCRKPFSISTIGVIDPGTSNILSVRK